MGFQKMADGAPKACPCQAEVCIEHLMD